MSELVKLKAPRGLTSFCHEGIEYIVEGKIITVPAHALEVMISHGFHALEREFEGDPNEPAGVKQDLAVDPDAVAKAEAEALKAAQIESATKALAAAQESLAAETDEAKKPELQAAVDQAEADLVKVQA